MRQRDWRTAGGLVLIGIAVWIAAWLLGPGDGGGAAVPAGSEPSLALPAAPGAHDAAKPGDAAPVLPTALLDARTAPNVEADWPGEALHLTGRVVDAAGQPVATALVTHWPTEMERSQVGIRRGDTFRDGIEWSRVASTHSDADGRFALDVHDQTLERHALTGQRAIPGLFADAAEARPILIVEHPEHATLALRLVVARAGDVDVGTVVLADGTTLTGRLVDPNGRPVAGVALSLELDELLVEEEKKLLELQLGRVAAVSDEAGDFRITGLWPGTFTLETPPTTYAPLTRKVMITRAGERALGNVPLAAGGSIRGIVLDLQDKPLPGAQVRARPGFGSHADADAYAMWDVPVRYGNRILRHDSTAGDDGHFTITGLWDAGPDFQVLARSDGFDPTCLVKVAAGSDVVLRLEPQAVWRLTVVDAISHEPVRDATVSGLRGARQGDFIGRITAEADGDAFLLRGAGRDGSVAIVSAPGHALQSFPLPGLAAGARGEQTLSLRRESVLAGRVVDDAHQPVPDAIVSLQPPAELHDEARQLFADEQGHFRFEGLGSGQWALGTAAHGCVPMGGAYAVALQDGESLEELELVLLRGATITGVVLGESAEPVPDGWVFAESNSPDAIAATALSGRPQDAMPDATPWPSLRATSFTDAEGRFELAGLAPGAWHVDGQEGAEASVTLAARDTVDVVLKRAQPSRVAGRVTREGQGVADALVELGWGPEIGSGWQTLATTHTDAGGNYLLQHASDEAVYLRANSDGHASRAQPVKLELGQTQHVDVALPTGRVRGRVIDSASGAPVGDVPLQLGDPARLAKASEDVFGLQTVSAPDGSFAFEPVGAGTWLLVADPGAASWSAATRQALTLVEGQPLPDVTVSLQPGASLEVTAVSSAKLRVGLRPPEGGGGEAYPRRTSAGTYLFTRLAAGEWELTVQRLENKKWPLVHSQTVGLSPGQALQVQVQLSD
ncbi:MAG TPA: hypothetical protein VFY71_03355 [Planctomycetota bacterium]|nr:hypothetical protein [Planctomycetota bacterium]